MQTEQTPQELIKELQKEVDETAAKWQEMIYTICEKLDYKGSSKFSYNIDRLNQFKNELNSFNNQ